MARQLCPEAQARPITNKKNQTTTSAKVAKGDVVEIEGMNFDSAKKAFDQWKVESGDAEISNPYQEKTTLTVKGEDDVTVKASYMTPRTVTVTDGNGTVKGLTQHGTEKIFAGGCTFFQQYCFLRYLWYIH